MHCRQFTTAVGFVVVTLWAAAEVAASQGGGAITAVPPATYPGTLSVKAAAAALPLHEGPARRIDLAAPTAAAATTLKSRNATTSSGEGDKGRPLAIGFGRDVPLDARRVVLADLAWDSMGDGNRAARIEVTSPDAAALRVALRLSAAVPGLAVRFAGSATASAVFGAGAFDASAASGLQWSPVLAGDTAIVELRVPDGASLAGVVLEIPRVSHHLVTGAALRSLSPHDAKAIGSSGFCNVDVACVTPVSQAVLNAARSVARMSFVADDGFSYLCTGTLVNDSVVSFTPYLFTANHCIDSAATARTLNTYWFYDAATCNDRNTPAFVQLAGGAAMLGRSPDFDWALLRLLETPPSGTVFSAWRAEPIPAGAVVSVIHHPRGDLKKWSQGNLTGITFLGDSGVYGNFNEVTWTTGTTEGGSSGAALLTFLQSAGYYEVRGGLFGGGASCATPTFPDYFSDLREALPVLRQYLTPNASNPSGVVAATEFYNRTLDHFFISTNPVEINNLDSGATIGWVRTGLRFLVYSGPIAGANPVCRFYRAPAYGDSHFYSASPAECAATALAHPVDWIYESPNVFYVPLPNTATGACPLGTKAVYRYFNQFTENHRYTVEVTVRDQLAGTSGWIPEGYGPGPYYPIMCALAP
jgi:lysyl endopeptidase